MSRVKVAMNSPGNGEVRVEKVDRIGFVYNAITKPSVYANPRPATVTKKPIDNATIISRNKIDEYIARKKKQFVQEG